MTSATNEQSPPFSLTIERFAESTFTVRELRGKESSNRPWRMVVTATSPTAGVVEVGAALGMPAVLSIHTDETSRVFRGVVSAVMDEGLRDGDRAQQSRFTIVPPLALLELQRGSRIFQDVRVDDVLRTVLGAAQIQTLFRLSNPLPERPYVTQYRESDLDFVRRIAAEAGLSFWFESEVVVFADDAGAYPWIARPETSLVYRVASGFASPHRDAVSSFVESTHVRSEVAELREYDPTKPHVTLIGRAEPRLLGHDVTSFPLLETYEHGSDFLFPRIDEVTRTAEVIRRRRSKKRRRARAASRCPAISAGHRFSLRDHPSPASNRDHVVVSVRHHGRVGAGEDTYSNRFKVLPGDVLDARDPRRTRATEAVATATVVGPPGESIWVDSLGRVRVYFHWDRRGPKADSSCWVRSVQPWAGAGFGHQFIPRVGMEVAIAFEGGDPDKPIVTGSLYNATHPVPFALPANKTQSGVRTQSVPEGGFNELLFEDAGSRERIYVRAQRDFEVEVNHDHQRVVKHDERLQVGANRVDAVRGNATYSVDGDVHHTVRGDVFHRDHGDRADVVDGALNQRVGTRVLRVQGRDERDIVGRATSRYGADVTTHVTGNATTVVGTHAAPRAFTVRVEGTGAISTEDLLEISSAKGITLRCGESVMRLGADGIELVGASIRSSGGKAAIAIDDAGIGLSTEKVVAKLGDDVVIQTEKTSLSMAGEIKLDGPKILLNSPSQASEPAPPPREPPTQIVLVDPEGKPLGGRPFVIDLPDGSQRTGVTDQDGCASFDLPADGRVRFPGLTDTRAE